MKLLNYQCKVTRIIVVIMGLISFSSNAQSPIIQWQNTIGGNLQDFLSSIQQTPDGGFILGGHSGSLISGAKTESNCDLDWDYCMLKLDSVGNITWPKTLGGTEWDWFQCIKATSAGGYLTVGFSASNSSCDKTENSIGGSEDF